MRDPRQRHCFVIMLYGDRSDAGGRRIAFDEVDQQIIDKALAGMTAEYRIDIDCVRSDRIQEAGSIHTGMFERIAMDEIAIVDISMLNPNVFYELGIRHALRPGVTVLIKDVGSAIPFNIQGIRVIEYDAGDAGSYQHTREQIQAFVANGVVKDQADSPVLALLPNVRVAFKAEALPRSDRFEYQLSNGKRVGVITVTSST